VLLITLSHWERAGVRAYATTMLQLGRSNAFYHPLPLGEGWGEGLRDNNALPLTMLLLTLSHWERAGVRAYTV
jgi:hypothetical protein